LTAILEKQVFFIYNKINDRQVFEGSDIMEWFNLFGFVFITIIMIPNIIFAVKHKEAFVNKHNYKIIEYVEQVGRFGCFGFMIFNVPATWFSWWSDQAFIVYLVVNILLIALYLIIWIIFWCKNNVFKALALSIIPSVIFLFSGIMCRSVLLIISSLLFAPAHIFISCKNAN